MSNLEIRNLEPLDKEWYARFKEIASFEAHEYLDGDKSFREQQTLIV